MHELTISWPSGMKTFSPADSPVTLGRSLESSVVVSDLTASRQHLTFTWSEDIWQAEDVSTHGSFTCTGDALDKHWALTEDRNIRLGDPEAQDIEIKLSTTSETPLAPPLPPASEEYQMTTVFDKSNPLPEVDQPNSHPGQPVTNDIDNQFDDVLPPLPSQDPVGSDPAPVPGVLPGASPSMNDQLTNLHPADPMVTNIDPKLDGLPPLQVSDGVPPMPLPPLSQPPTFETPPTPTLPETPGAGVSASDEDDKPKLELDGFSPEDQVADSLPQPTERIIEETVGDDQPPSDEDLVETPPGSVVKKMLFDPIAHPSIEEQALPQGEPAVEDSESMILNGSPPPPPASNSIQKPATPMPVDEQPPAQPFTVWGPPETPVPMPDDFGETPQNLGPSAQIQNVSPQLGNPAGSTPGHWASQPSATAVQDHSLRVAIDNDHYVFQPHQEVTIGRDQSCTIVLDMRHSLASRQHVRATFRDGSWWMEDFSSKGTFVDGKQIKNPYQASGGFKALLGNKQAGTEVKIVAPGEHKINGKRRWPLFAALAAAAVLLPAVVGIGVLATQGGDEAVQSTVSPGQMEAAFLDQAKKSTVLIVSGNDQDVSTGSGFFVSDNLIVTNQHVVNGDDLVEIAVSNGNDDPVGLTYVGRILERHPFLDIAVIQLTGELVPASQADEDPNLSAPGFSIGELQSGNDSSVEVGPSDGLILGTTVFSTGFPGSFNTIGTNNDGGLQLPPVGTDSGDASSFAIWPGCSNPTAEATIPQGGPSSVQCNEDGDMKNAVVTTSLTSGPGASGSPVFQNGKVIAVVFAGAAGETSSGRSITSSSFIDWLDPIIAAN